MKDESEAWSLSNWMEEMENAKMGLEVGLNETGKADLGNCRNIVSTILGQK